MGEIERQLLLHKKKLVTGEAYREVTVIEMNEFKQLLLIVVMVERHHGKLACLGTSCEGTEASSCLQLRNEKQTQRYD